MVMCGHVCDARRYLERVDKAVQEAKELADGMSSWVLIVICQLFS